MRPKASAINLYKLPVFCSFLLLSVTIPEAKTYAGRVVDSETKTGLSGVLVTLLNSSGKTTTDQNGQFSISAEVSVMSSRFRHNEYNRLEWKNSVQAFSLRNAPQVQSLCLFNLKGELLFFKERAPGTDKISWFQK